MAVTMFHPLPQAPHELWQTAASPFILPMNWQTMYQRCPRCGGNAPNVCDDVWPEKWWEDDMLGLMYQGHIPPSQRTAPWEAYYADARLAYLSAMLQKQQPLRVDPGYKHHHPHETQYPVRAPMTPPMTPGTGQTIPQYSMAVPCTPSTPTMPFSRQGTWDSCAIETPQPTPSKTYDSTNGIIAL
jgi:hypothetical protein